MRADLQRYYGLNLDRLGTDFSAFHAAACLSCLPLGSSLLSAIDGRANYTYGEYLLHSIMSMLAGKEIPFPWDKKKTGIEGIETEAVPLDEFIDWYTNTSFKEVDEWRVQ